MTRWLVVILGLLVGPQPGLAGPLITMMTQSLRSMGLDMGTYQRLTRQDLLGMRGWDGKTFEHPASSGRVNVVYYAMVTDHPVGERVHDRSQRVATRDRRNCRDFPDGDAAQRMFLDAGGPAIDPHGLDPDGDGYACHWDPELYRHFLADPLAGRDHGPIDLNLAGPGHFED